MLSGVLLHVVKTAFEIDAAMHCGAWQRQLCRRFQVMNDPAVLGITVRAFVVARLREHSEQSIKVFEEGISHVNGVRACYHVTGQFDMLIELALRDLDHLGQLIRVDIARIPGVMNLETMLILAQSVADEGWPTVLEP